MTFPRQNIEETQIVVEDMLDALLETIIQNSYGPEAAELRHAIGDIEANLEEMVHDGTYTVALLRCFSAANDTGINLMRMEKLVRDLFALETETDLATATVQVSIVYALAQEARTIVKMTFTNREQIDALMIRIKSLFDDAKETAADHMDSSAYAALIRLAATLVHHLVITAQPLPQIVEYLFPAPMPSLAVSNRIYGVGSRSEELIATNRVVHPAFMNVDVTALSA